MPSPDDISHDDSSPDALGHRLGVSRETAAKLIVYVTELRRWQRITNLVSAPTLADVWERHIADCLQLAPLAEGSVWVDLGSGAGLPGLILSLARPDRTIHLVESDGRKCAFLQHAARLTGANARVWNGRIEAVLPRLDPLPTVVVARAVAALPKLLTLSQSLLTTGAVALFPKGRDHEAELTQARRSWTFRCDAIQSRTDPHGRILRIDHLSSLPPPEPNRPHRDD